MLHRDNISIRQLELNARTSKAYFFMIDVGHDEYKVGVAHIDASNEEITMLYDEMIEIQHKTGFTCNCTNHL